MYVSRLMFHTVPGKTRELEEELVALRTMVRDAGGKNPRILHSHFASTDAPDVVFMQDAPDLESLEEQIRKVTGDPAFQEWTKKVSSLLRESPNREIYAVIE